jgi:hypothetical protein
MAGEPRLGSKACESGKVGQTPMWGHSPACESGQRITALRDMEENSDS